MSRCLSRGSRFFFSFSLSFLPLLSFLLFTLSKRNVDQQLLVRVGLEEEAGVLAVALLGFGEERERG